MRCSLKLPTFLVPTTAFGVRNLAGRVRSVQITQTLSSEASVLKQHSIPLGQRVRFGAKRIREQCLPDQTRTGYVRVLVNNVLAGNVFACRWKQHGKTVCWITQLVVSKDYRRRGLATGLLNMLRHDSDDIYGVMSSHPAACLAAANAFSGILSYKS